MRCSASLAPAASAPPLRPCRAGAPAGAARPPAHHVYAAADEVADGQPAELWVRLVVECQGQGDDEGCGRGVGQGGRVPRHCGRGAIDGLCGAPLACNSTNPPLLACVCHVRQVGDSIPAWESRQHVFRGRACGHGAAMHATSRSSALGAQHRTPSLPHHTIAKLQTGLSTGRQRGERGLPDLASAFCCLNSRPEHCLVCGGTGRMYSASTSCTRGCTRTVVSHRHIAQAGQQEAELPAFTCAHLAGLRPRLLLPPRRLAVVRPLVHPPGVAAWPGAASPTLKRAVPVLGRLPAWNGPTAGPGESWFNSQGTCRLCGVSVATVGVSSAATMQVAAANAASTALHVLCAANAACRCALIAPRMALPPIEPPSADLHDPDSTFATLGGHPELQAGSLCHQPACFAVQAAAACIPAAGERWEVAREPLHGSQSSRRRGGGGGSAVHRL